MFTVEELVTWSGGVLLQGDRRNRITMVHIDSRQIKDGALFIALTGGARDGHQFIEDAIQSGATAVILSRDNQTLRSRYPHVSFVAHKDTLAAFQQVAAQYRRQLEIPIIAVTGSNGKTTTKDMVAHLLSAGYHVSKTYKNYNNHLGVPLSLLAIRPDHEQAVLEMGMNHAGELTLLADLAKPTTSIITNVGEAHLQYFGTREKIAEAKGEILPGTDPKGYVLLNGDDPLVLSQAERYPGQIYTYSVKKKADIYASQLTYSEEGSFFKVHLEGQNISCFIPLFGEHNISNLLPAIFIAYRSGIALETIREKMITLSISEMRFQTIAGPGGSIIVNDAYNASPTSIKAAVRTFADIYPHRKKVVVLGDVFELGDRADELHKELGQFLYTQPCDLITIGNKAALISQEAGGTHVGSHREAALALQPYLNEEYAILLKASRGMQLEKVLDHLFQKSRFS